MFADILGIPVEVPEGSELGALGVAICAATGIGAYPNLATAIGAMTGVARRHEPRAERAVPHLRKYPRYRALTEAFASAWSAPAQGAAHA
jgi:L-xylulokinase